ncbi:ribonuclease H-like domain-containing protein [Tanacetum coccineum]
MWNVRFNTIDTSGQIKVLPPRTAEEIVARERERKARTTLLMALPEDHLAKFHKMTDAREMFQSLLSQLEIHGAGVSTEDANQKFLRSLPSAWSQSDIKGSTASSSSSPQNVAFVSENTSSTNEVSTAYCVPNLSGQNSKYEQTSSYSLLANQSSCPQLDHEDLEQIDEYDLEEMDLKWQVAMISMRMKKFYKKTGRKLQFDAKEPVGFDKTKVECYNCHKTGHFARECRIKGTQDNRRRDAWNSGNKDGSRTGQKEDSKALVTIDGEGVDWTNHSEDEDYALMACNSSNSDTKVISCSNKCKESYANLKKLYDAQREQLSDASIEIKAYSQGLKKVEAQLVAHQQGQLWYEQKIKFMKIDLDDKTDVLTYHKKLLAEAQKEKEDLKAKVEKWHNSSKNLSKLLNTQMSANDKFGLGYGDHRYDGILSYENEVLQSVFMNKKSEIENQPLYDRFVTAEGMHAVPPPMTGNYMPSGPDVEVDDSKFTYGPKQTQTNESESQSSEFDTCESNISEEPSELVSEPVVNVSNVKSQPKVWSDAPIIEEYESDSDDECVVIPTKQQESPSFANQQVKTPRENVKSKYTHSQKPKVDKKDLGHGFAVRACFVCGSLNHLIRDCDFHEKRMARKAELKNGLNNVQRVNKQNQFVPSAVLTRTGIIPVNTARTSVLLGEKGKLLLSPQQVVIGDHKDTMVDPNTIVDPVLEIDYPHRALKNKGIVDSGCSRHMTGNKAYLAEFQDFNGGPVAFGGSKGYITSKGKIKTRKLDFEDVCFVKELQHFNLFSVSQMCDKKNKVLFTDSECLVLSPEFKLPDENQVLLKIPKQNNMYSFNLENIVPSGGLACLIAKATIDESNKWHRRLGHVNFKNLNKLVKGNLVRGLPSKIFQNDHTCVACQKGKQHKASCKAKSVSSISHSLQLLHMDLFGPTSVRSLNHKTYCLVITDDFSRAYLKSVSVMQRFPRKSFSKKHKVHKESVSKQGRKFAKGESSVQRDPLFDEMPEDTVDHMDTENAQDEGRTREIVDEDKEIEENALSTEEVLSTDKEGVSTDIEKVSTDRPIVSTDGSKVSTDKQIESTDEQVEGTEEPNEGTEEQNEDIVENFEGTEEKVESTDGHKKVNLMVILKLIKCSNQLESAEEMARKLQEGVGSLKWKENKLLAEELQEQEREQFTIEERAKFLHDTIAAQRRFLAQQRSEAIRNRPPTKMQALYEKIKRSDEDFISIGSAEDERLIKRMNEKGVDFLYGRK